MIKIGLNALIYQTSQGQTKPIDGIGVYTQQLAQQLPKNQVNVHLAQINHRQVALSHFGMRYISNIDEKAFDLYHCTNYLLPKFKTTPAICTIHDAFMFSTPHLVNPKLRRCKNFLLKKFIQSAQHYIAISHAMVPDLITHWGIDETQISVIHSGINQDWFTPLSQTRIKQLLATYQLPESFLLSVGTLTPRKNILRILQAIKLLPSSLSTQCPLVLVGKPWLNDHNLIKLLQQLEQQQKLIWLRYIPNEKLQAIYQAAKALIFPSLGEGFGYPVIEAFASNTPVLTSNITSLPEIAGNAALMVDPMDIDEIAAGMTSLISDESLCQQLVSRGYARAQLFTWDKCLQQTIAVYNKVL